MANTSQISGERKFTHRSRSFGYGDQPVEEPRAADVDDGEEPRRHHREHRHRLDARATAVRHFARKRNSTAEMRVPEWAMPTQKTKSVM